MEDIDNAQERAPGANDNASGVAVVLELARILSKIELEYNIQFAFFSGEEQGLWGSRSYAQHIKDNNVHLHLLLNLDMVGRPPSNNRKVIIERDIDNSVSTNDLESLRFARMMEYMAINYTDLQVALGPIYSSD
jgi:Zn-dependent M28 family amino/carboxypeptidase